LVSARAPGSKEARSDAWAAALVRREDKPRTVVRELIDEASDRYALECAGRGVVTFARREPRASAHRAVRPY
jgi:hypothetical protein